METLKKLLNHERYQSAAVVLICCFLVWFYGCESKVASLIATDKKVNRAELNAELQSLASLADLRIADLDQQDAIRQTIIEQALLVGTTGQLNPYGIMAALAATLGIGATVDNVRKRTEIKKLKSG